MLSVPLPFLAGLTFALVLHRSLRHVAVPGTRLYFNLFLVLYALQGVGIGVIPIGIATMREILPARRLAPAISLMSSSLGVGGALGLPAAAALAQYGSWQWMFWGSGALGVAIIVMMMVRLRTLPAAKPDGTLDVIGAVVRSAVVVVGKHGPNRVLQLVRVDVC